MARLVRLDWRPLLLLLLLAASSSGCSGDDGEKMPSVDLTREDSQTFDVTWQDGVKQLTAAEAKDLLLDADPAAGTLLFDSAATQVAALAPQELVVLEGLGAFRVLALETVAEGVQLTAEPAALTDVIKDGEIAWDQRFFSGQAEEMIGLGIGQQAYALSGSYDNGELTFSDTISGWDVSFTLSPEGTGYRVTFLGEYKNGDALAKVSGKGTLSGFRNQGQITIAGSSITDFLYYNEGLVGDLELEMGGVELGLGSMKVEVPAKLTFPFQLGPIPATLSLGGSLELESTLTAQTTAIAKAKLHFEGAAGVKLDGGSIVPLGKLYNYKLSYEEGDQVGTVDAGLGALFDFPTVELGIGILSTGPEVFFKVKNEVVTNLSLRYDAAGTVPVITGNCLEVNVDLGGYVGGSFKVLGFTLAEDELPIFTQLMPKYQKGDACE